LNIPEEKVHEVGNFEAVATIRDTPDLSFGLESWDVSTEIEALLTFTDPTMVNDGDAFDFGNHVPMDIISPIKDGWNIFQASRGVVIPYLTLESSRYRFEMRGNASQNHTLRGDSYFFVDGSPYYEEYDGDGTTASFTLSHTAQPYDYLGKTYYALGVCVTYADRTYARLFLDDHYTNTATTVTLVDPTIAPIGSTVKVVYGSADPSNYPQTVHQGVSVKPAAVRGRNVDVYVGTADATPVFSRWTSVQSAEVNWTVTLDKDEEFGNAQYVSQDHDVPEVAGNIVIRPRNTKELWDRVQAVTNVLPGNVAGPLTSVGLPVEIRISDPETGVRLKTLYIPDARFKPPAIEGRVQQKLGPTAP
jgi:3D (Asp-Asp-Asp) domain-containing protein